MDNNSNSNGNSSLANNPALNTIDLKEIKQIDQDTDDNSIGRGINNM